MSGAAELGFVSAQRKFLEEFARETLEREMQDRIDAARYRLLRRGQHWSVIDGSGDTLRGDALDAVVDLVLKKKVSQG